MKKTNRLLAALLAIAAVTATAPMSAFATDYNAEGNGLTDVTWTSNAAYTVTIPQSVALGETATVSASDVNLNAGEQLNVTLSGTSDADNAFKLTTATDSLTYTVSKETEDVAVGDVVLNVAAGTQTGSSTLTFNEPATIPNAGDYMGTVTFTISVKSAKTDVSSVAIDDKTTTALTKGNTLTLSATVDDAATDKSIVWSSSDATVASVDSTGKVTANKTGSAIITVTATNGTEDTADDKTDTITITVTNPANGITLNKSTLTLTEGCNETLTATVSPTDADGTVSWSSNKTSVATVDSNGKVTAVAPGTATITATIGGKSATCTVTVNSATVTVTGIIINNAPTEALFVNSTGTLTATVSPDNATDKTVVWSSSDPDYVSINAETGEYTVMGKKGYGSATITATATNGTEDTSDDVTATCTITGKVTYTSLSAGTVLHVGDTFYAGKVYFNTTPYVSFQDSNGVITLVENNGCYKFKRGSNGTMPNVTAYKVKDNTDGIYIVSGSGTSTSDRFTLAVHTK